MSGSEFYVQRQWFSKTAIDELFNTDYRIAPKDRLYNLASTYFEGLCEQNSRERFAYNGDECFDCSQAAIVFITAEGFAIGYDMRLCDTLNKKTLRIFLYNRCRQVTHIWVMNRSIPTKKVFADAGGKHTLSCQNPNSHAQQI